MNKISVIIMTLNAEKYIHNMLDMLAKQTVVANEIIVADSESTDNTIKIAEEYEGVKVLNIKRSEFDHGGSRHYALNNSCGDYILFFTQDAEIGDEHYIENLISNFDDPSVAMVCGRQIAKEDAVAYERLIREFNYPDEKKIRTAEDINSMGIKAFYMSDACSAYRRSAYSDIGGFEYPILTNEDMLIAAHALKKGYKTVYEPAAYVYHSHNFTCSQEYKRNFDVAAFMAMHEKEFEGMNIDGEGFRLVKYVSVRLLKKCQLIQFIKFGMICTAKLLGNRKGKRALLMNEREVLKHTNGINFWKKYYSEKKL